MFATFSRSWQLVKASWAVLRADKELIVFPIVSMIGMVIVTIAFAFPALAAGIFDSVTTGRGSSNGILSLIVGFLFYVVIYMVIFYANTALVGAAMIRLRGGDPTLRDGFRIASEHAGAILGYAAIAATVGIDPQRHRAAHRDRRADRDLDHRLRLERGDLSGRSGAGDGERQPARGDQAQRAASQDDVGRAVGRQFQHRLGLRLDRRCCGVPDRRAAVRDCRVREFARADRASRLCCSCWR